MSISRPYSITEDDQWRLKHALNSVRLLQYLTEAQHQGPISPETLTSFLWVLEEQLAQVFASTKLPEAWRARK